MQDETSIPSFRAKSTPQIFRDFRNLRKISASYARVIRDSCISKTELERKVKDKIEFKNSILWEKDLTKAILTGAILTNAILNWADLTKADLTEAKLNRADLTEANLYKATLTRANLNGANLTDATLTRADLNWADLTRADLHHAKLNWADLIRADLTEATLNGANLTDATLTEATLNGADLIRADLTEATLNCATLTKANLTDATLTEANLNGATLTDATLNWANLADATLNWADLTKATLTEARLNGANLAEADLSGAKLKKAKLTEATLNGANLTDATLNWADLTKATLNGANLTEVQILHANFTEATFDNNQSMTLNLTLLKNTDESLDIHLNHINNNKSLLKSIDSISNTYQPLKNKLMVQVLDHIEDFDISPHINAISDILLNNPKYLDDPTILTFFQNKLLPQFIKSKLVLIDTKCQALCKLIIQQLEGADDLAFFNKYSGLLNQLLSFQSSNPNTTTLQDEIKTLLSTIIPQDHKDAIFDSTWNIYIRLEDILDDYVLFPIQDVKPQAKPSYVLIPKKAFQNIIDGNANENDFKTQVYLASYNNTEGAYIAETHVSEKLENLYKSIPILSPYYTQFYSKHKFETIIDTIFKWHPSDEPITKESLTDKNKQAQTYSNLFKAITNVSRLAPNDEKKLTLDNANTEQKQKVIQQKLIDIGELFECKYEESSKQQSGDNRRALKLSSDFRQQLLNTLGCHQNNKQQALALLCLATVFARFSSSHFLGSEHDSPQPVREMALALMNCANELDSTLFPNKIKNWQDKFIGLNGAFNCTAILSDDMKTTLLNKHNHYVKNDAQKWFNILYPAAWP